MSNTCNRCGAAIVWPQPYQQGAKPLNSDGATVHSCGGAAPQQPTAAAPQPQPTASITSPAQPVVIPVGRTEAEKTEDARHMIEILWGMASHKALEVIPKSNGEDENFADQGQRLILAEVFYKSLTYSWVKN